MLVGAGLSDRRAWRWQTAAGAVAGVGVALPALLWTAQGMGGRHDPDFARLLFIKQGYHHFTRYWGVATWATLAVFTLFAVALLLDRPRWRVGPRPLVGAMAALGVSWVISFLCTEVWAVPAIMKLHLYRADVYPILIVVLLGCDWVARQGLEPEPGETDRPLGAEDAPGGSARSSGFASSAPALDARSLSSARVAGLIGGGLLLGEWLLIAWGAWALLWRRRRTPVGRWLTWGPLLVGGLALPALVHARTHMAFLRHWAETSVAVDSGLYLVLAVVAVTMAVDELFLRRQEADLPAGTPQYRRSLQAIVIVIAGLLWLPHGARAWRHVAARSLSNLSAQDQGYRDLQRWCARHTPKDALFLVPPTPDGFRVFSQRPIYCDWKSFALWAPGYERIWWQRLTNEVGTDILDSHGIPDLDRINRRYGALSAVRVQELARQAGARYVVRAAADGLPFRVACRNEWYCLYEVPAADGVRRDWRPGRPGAAADPHADRPRGPARPTGPVR
jgi:hypothetical protein